MLLHVKWNRSLYCVLLIVTGLVICSGCKSVPSTCGQMEEHLRKNGINYYVVDQNEQGEFALELCEDTRDIGCLHGLKIRVLGIGYSKVRDLTPLVNCPLVYIDICSNQVTDVRPLTNTPLRVIDLTPNLVSNTIESLRGLETIQTINLLEVNKFWTEWDQGKRDIGFPRRPPSVIFSGLKIRSDQRPVCRGSVAPIGVCP